MTEDVHSHAERPVDLILSVSRDEVVAGSGVHDLVARQAHHEVSIRRIVQRGGTCD